MNVVPEPRSADQQVPRPLWRAVRRLAKAFKRLLKRPARRILRHELSELRDALRRARAQVESLEKRGRVNARQHREALAESTRKLAQGEARLAEAQRRERELVAERNILYGAFPEDIETDPIGEEFRAAHFSYRALAKLLDCYDFETVLDIGSGAGAHSSIFLRHGKAVTALDYGRSPYYEQRDPRVTVLLGDFNSYAFPSQFDCVWASHVLEHQPNPHSFLRKLHETVAEGGVIGITVPPLKHQIVGGHVGLWNGGLLLYHLVLAGFDCREARVLRYGYNISVLVKKQSLREPLDLSFDHGDLRKIKRYLPVGLEFASSESDDPFNGDVWRLNW